MKDFKQGEKVKVYYRNGGTIAEVVEVRDNGEYLVREENGDLVKVFQGAQVIERIESDDLHISRYKDGRPVKWTQKKVNSFRGYEKKFLKHGVKVYNVAGTVYYKIDGCDYPLSGASIRDVLKQVNDGTPLSACTIREYERRNGKMVSRAVGTVSDYTA